VLTNSPLPSAGVRVSIISHKTEYPALGERVNLRDAARAWLAARGLVARHGIDPDDILFLGTLAEKLAAIADRGCTHFVDDLVEVLGHAAFPAGVVRILYGSPCLELPAGVVAFDSWDGIRGYLLGVPR
jgi:hypothetical protein